MLSGFLKKYWFEIILLTTVMAVHLYAATSDAYNFPANWFTRDDAYYYFKVAQNITEGHGITFDGINPTNGYHPLWMLVNLPIFALARFDLILPLRILLLVQGALSAATAVLIYRTARGVIAPLVGVVAGSWWAFDLSVHNVMYEYGLETGLASMAAALLIYRLLRFEKTWRTRPPTLREIAGLAALGALAMLSRLDLVFLAGLAGLWIILRGNPMRVLLPLDMLLAGISVFASMFLRLGVSGYYGYAQISLAFITISAAAKLVLYLLFGLYQPITARRFSQTIRATVMAVSGSTIITGVVLLAAAPLLGGFPRLALFYDWLINLAGALALRGLWRVFTQRTKAERVSPLNMLKASAGGWLKEGVVYFGTLIAPLGLYMLFNKLAIGAAMPVSGQIKRWWGAPGSRAYGGAARSPLSFFGLELGPDFNAWSPVTGWLEKLSRGIAGWRGFYRNDEAYTVLLLAAGAAWVLILLIDRRKAVRVSMQAGLPLLLTASVVQILSYNATGYSAMKEWYWITQPIFLVLALGLAAWLLLQPLFRSRIGNSILAAGAALFCLWMGWNFSAAILQRMPHGAHAPGGAYMDSVRFLEENTPPGSMIGMTGGGNVGYYIQDRTIVNMDGLINSPGYFEALKEGQASRYLQAMGMDYIFANPEILQAVPYKGQFVTGPILEHYGGKALMEFAP